MSDALRTLSSAYRSTLGRFGLLGSQRRSREDRAPVSGLHGRLFRKYLLLLVGLVSFVLLINAGLHFWFSYNENKAALFRVQQEKAKSAAHRIEEFVEEIDASSAGRRPRNGPRVRSSSAASTIFACCAKCRPSPS